MPHIANFAAFMLLLLHPIADSAPFLLLLLPHIADSVASYGRFESLFDAYAALILLPYAPPMPCTFSGHISPRGGARRSSRFAGISKLFAKGSQGMATKIGRCTRNLDFVKMMLTMTMMMMLM